MTVKELIDKLKIYPDDSVVRISNSDYELREHKEVIDFIGVSDSELDLNGVYLVAD